MKEGFKYYEKKNLCDDDRVPDDNMLCRLSELSY